MPCAGSGSVGSAAGSPDGAAAREPGCRARRSCRRAAPVELALDARGVDFEAGTRLVRVSRPLGEGRADEREGGHQVGLPAAGRHVGGMRLDDRGVAGPGGAPEVGELLRPSHLSGLAPVAMDRPQGCVRERGVPEATDEDVGARASDLAACLEEGPRLMVGPPDELGSERQPPGVERGFGAVAESQSASGTVDGRQQPVRLRNRQQPVSRAHIVCAPRQKEWARAGRSRRRGSRSRPRRSPRSRSPRSGARRRSTPRCRSNCRRGPG